MISVHTSPLARQGSPDAGGMNTYVRQLSRELSLRGVYVDTFTRRNHACEPSTVNQTDRARVVQIKSGPLKPLGKEEMFDTLGEFANGIEAFRRNNGLSYDLVHSHYWLSGWVGQELKRLWNLPHVTMFHTVAAAKKHAWPANDDSERRWRAEYDILRAADAVVVASQHERTFMQHMCGERRRPIVAIPCGVDLDLFVPHDRQASKRALGLGGKQVVLFVGRIVPLKGVDILVEAAARLSSLPDLQIVIVGGDGERDPELQRLRWRAKELDLDERVRFEGATEQALLPVYYSAADVCVIPSHYESFGLVAAEALACGTPVVASKVGGLPTIVRDRVNGLLVPWQCPQVFADRIAEILTNKSLHESLRRRARMSVLNLSWGKVADEVLALYDSLLAEAVPSGAVSTAEPKSSIGGPRDAVGQSEQAISW